MITKRHRIFWVCLVSFILGSIGLFTYTQIKKQQRRGLQHLQATVLHKPRPVGPFQLKDITGQGFTERNLKGRWTFLFFGFTHCHAICPTTLAELAKTYRLLQDKHVSKLPHVLLVSLDPHVDGPTTLKKYVQSFHPKFSGVTGDIKQINRLTRQLGITYMHSKENKIDHSGTIVLINPAGDVFAYFSMPHHAQSIANDYQKIMTALG